MIHLTSRNNAQKLATNKLIFALLLSIVLVCQYVTLQGVSKVRIHLQF